VIQAPALPGLWQVIALTWNGLNCFAEDRHKHETAPSKQSGKILTGE
jgi:hypothetical protein